MGVTGLVVMSEVTCGGVTVRRSPSWATHVQYYYDTRAHMATGRGAALARTIDEPCAAAGLYPMNACPPYEMRQQAPSNVGDDATVRVGKKTKQTP